MACNAYAARELGILTLSCWRGIRSSHCTSGSAYVLSPLSMHLDKVEALGGHLKKGRLRIFGSLVDASAWVLVM